MELGYNFYIIWHWLPVPRAHFSWNDCNGHQRDFVLFGRSAYYAIERKKEEGYIGFSENHWFTANSYAATSHAFFLGYCYSIVLNEVKKDRRNFMQDGFGNFRREDYSILLEVPARYGGLVLGA